MKDGIRLASINETAELKLNTLNTVVVFSNKRPKFGNFAQDRLRIFKIKGDDVIWCKSRALIGWVSDPSGA